MGLYISGFISGIISALGMGGGTILIIFLSIFLGIDQHRAQANNIIFFVPTSITAIIMNIKNKNIKWDIAKIICPFGIIGAIVGAIISINIDTIILKKLYGVFLGIIAIYEILCLTMMHKNNSKTHNKK